MENTLTSSGLSQWVDAHMARMGQSAIRISDGIVVYFDTAKKAAGLPQADYFFVTHDHRDHFSPDLIRELRGPGTHVVVPESMREKGQDKGVSTVGIRPGESKTIGVLTVTAVPAYNLRKPMHPRRKDYVGYCLTLPNGISVYHAGDTDFVPEMMDLKPDIALIPVGGGATMNWKEALSAMGAIGARITIPIHYGLIPFSTTGAKKFLARGGRSVKELP